MNTNKFIKKYISFSLGIWLRPIISLFTTPIITWLINPSEFGKAMMYSTFYSIVQWIILLGTPNAFMRFFPQKSEDEHSKLLWSSMYFPFLFWALASTIIFIFRKYINTFLTGLENIDIHVILSISLLTSIFQSFVLNLTRLKGKGIFYSFLLILETLSYSIFAIVFAIFVEKTFLTLIFAQLVSNLTVVIFGVIFEKDYWFNLRIDLNLAKEIIKFGAPYSIIGISWLLFNWTDRIVLRMFVDFHEIGLYSAAFKLVTIINMFNSGFITLWFPFAYEQFEKKTEFENKYIFLRAFDFVSFGMFSLGFLILLFKDAIFIIFAKDYRPAASISPFLFLSPIMISLEVIVGRGIDFVKKTNWFIVIYLSATIMNLAGNFILIPFFGAKGAAISTGLSTLFLFAFESNVSYKLYPIEYNTKRLYKTVGLFILVAVICTFFSSIISILFSIFGLIMTMIFYKKEFITTLTELKKYLGKMGILRKQ